MQTDLGDRTRRLDRATYSKGKSSRTLKKSKNDAKIVGRSLCEGPFMITRQHQTGKIFLDNQISTMCEWTRSFWGTDCRRAPKSLSSPQAPPPFLVAPSTGSLCDRECDWEAPISPYLASKHKWESSTASF